MSRTTVVDRTFRGGYPGNVLKNRVRWLMAGLGLGMLAMAALRWAAAHPSPLTPLAGLATPGYVAVVVVFTIAMVRAGLPLNRVGFGRRLNLRHVLLALAAIAVLRVFAFTLEPMWEHLLGAPRDLGRFAGVEGSPGSLAALLAMSWTVAAFGEEIAYRIVLLRGISFVLGDTRAAQGAALVLQAALFGLIHAYQGPAGIAGAASDGLVFGAVTLAARWSIWPAALAHGVNNTIGILKLYGG